MHETTKRSIRNRASVRNWAVTLIAALLTFALLAGADNRGIPKKWVTAVMGTLVPFSYVVYACRRQLRHSFWMSLSICLAIHSLAIWAIFQYVLVDFQNVSIWLWFPVMLIETFVLLVAVKRIEEKYASHHETNRIHSSTPD